MKLGFLVSIFLLALQLGTAQEDPDSVPFRLASYEWNTEEKILVCRYEFEVLGSDLRYAVVSGINLQQGEALEWRGYPDFLYFQIWRDSEWVDTTILGRRWCGTGVGMHHFVPQFMDQYIEFLIGDLNEVREELESLKIEASHFAFRVGVKVDLVMKDGKVAEKIVYSDPCILEVSDRITPHNELNGGFRFWTKARQLEYLNTELLRLHETISSNEFEPDS